MDVGFEHIQDAVEHHGEAPVAATANIAGRNPTRGNAIRCQGNRRVCAGKLRKIRSWQDPNISKYPARCPTILQAITPARWTTESLLEFLPFYGIVMATDSREIAVKRVLQVFTHENYLPTRFYVLLISFVFNRHLYSLEILCLFNFVVR